MAGSSHQDEFYAQGDLLHAFVAEVRAIIAASRSPREAASAIRIPFSRLLSNRGGLPQEFRRSSDHSAMGAGVGNWLLYRSADRSLTLSVLVLPPGMTTPVHDHLAWGLVGLYDGAQEERVYRLVRSLGEGHGELESVSVGHLNIGDFYELMPPDNDIHSVTTTSPGPSLSLHLLATDLGCIWRHEYHPTRATVRAFRSGYSNVACDDEPSGTGKA